MQDLTAQGYDAIATEYATRLGRELEHKPFDRAFLDRFVAQLPEGKVLDVGCGPGHVGQYVMSKGVTVAGIDLSPQMVAVARALEPDMQLTVGDMRALPFPPETFAGLVTFYSIVHLSPDELEETFCELRRVLVPGGLLALTFHVGDEVRHIDALWGIQTCLDFIFFQPRAVEASLIGAGFEILEQTVRDPYDAAVEAQTQRWYGVMRKPG